MKVNGGGQRLVSLHQEVGDDGDSRQHRQGDSGLGDDVVDGQRAGNACLLVGIRSDRGPSDALLRRGARGSGAELRVSALLLGQRTKYRVASLPHRRFLS